MTKFHINTKGLPAPCKAEDGNCPFGGVESHYNSEKEAQVKADEMASEEFGLLGTIDTGENDRIKKMEADLGELVNRMNKHVDVLVDDIEKWLEETEG